MSMHDTHIRSVPDMLKTNILVSHYAGSKAYGTNLPTSDIDIRGIFCADPIYYRSPWLSCGEASIPEDEDTKYYELSKFMKLLVDQNPNIVETLWVDPSDIITDTPAYQLLREYREELLSSKCAFTYSGYAHSQLQRIKGHNKWINNPQPEQPPRQIDYMSLVVNLSEEKLFKVTGSWMEQHQTDYKLVSYGNRVYGVYPNTGHKSMYDSKYILNVQDTILDGEFLQPPKMVVKFNYDVYKHDLENHSNYWKWKNNRNQSRSELEELYGYDTKHAMHLMRLLRTGHEIITEGVVRVKRPDAAQLLDIRAGKYTYEEIVEEADDLKARIEQRYKTTDLRRTVNIKRASRLVCGIQDLCWS